MDNDNQSKLIHSLFFMTPKAVPHLSLNEISIIKNKERVIHYKGSLDNEGYYKLLNLINDLIPDCDVNTLFPEFKTKKLFEIFKIEPEFNSASKSLHFQLSSITLRFCIDYFESKIFYEKFKNKFDSKFDELYKFNEFTDEVDLNFAQKKLKNILQSNFKARYEEFSDVYGNFIKDVSFHNESLLISYFILQSGQISLNLNGQKVANSFHESYDGSKDVFLCHTSSNKLNIVEPLVSQLEDNNISYWYDSSELKWGDSLVEKINTGLSSSRYVIVVLSKDFIDKPWQNKELNASFNIEASTGEIRVLPLLVGSKSERKMILESLPLLNDKLYLTWENNPKEIVQSLKNRLN